MLNKGDLAKAGLMALVLAAAQPLQTDAAGNAIGIVAVSALVQPSALLKLELPPTGLAVSQADIERGYIEIPAGLFLRVNAGRIVPSLVLDLTAGQGVVKSLEGFAEQPEKSTAPSETGLLPAARIAYRFMLSGKAQSVRVPAPLILNIAL